jgi:hypothetical protein
MVGYTTEAIIIENAKDKQRRTKPSNNAMHYALPLCTDPSILFDAIVERRMENDLAQDFGFSNYC